MQNGWAQTAAAPEFWFGLAVGAVVGMAYATAQRQARARRRARARRG